MNLAGVMNNSVKKITFILEEAGIGSARTVNISVRLVAHSSAPSTKFIFSQAKRYTDDRSVAGRYLTQSQNAKAASEAQACMADHRDSSDSATTDRLSDGRF